MSLEELCSSSVIRQTCAKKAISSKYWKDENDLDLKRRKEAEFLVSGDLPVNAIEGFVVYTETTAEIISNCLALQILN